VVDPGPLFSPIGHFGAGSHRQSKILIENIPFVDAVKIKANLKQSAINRSINRADRQDEVHTAERPNETAGSMYSNLSYKI